MNSSSCIANEQSDAERGKVTGTPVGCACGEGVIDWEQVLRVCVTAPRDLVLSVECGTVDEAERSLVYLENLLRTVLHEDTLGLCCDIIEASIHGRS